MTRDTNWSRRLVCPRRATTGRPTKLALVAALLALGGCSTAAPKVSAPQTAILPADYAIYPPDPGVPAPIGAFLGVWEGQWPSGRGGDVEHKLVVHHVTAAGTMRGVYAAVAQAGAAGSVPVPVGGRIDGPRLVLTDTPNHVDAAYELQPDGTLRATLAGEAGSGVLRRRPDV